MKTTSHKLRKTAIAAAVVAIVGGTPLLNDSGDLETGWYSVISAAHADSDGSGGGDRGHKGAMGAHSGGQGGQGPGGRGYKGGKSIADVLSDDDDGDEDSDRPDWAQSPGRDDKPGRGNFGGNTQKGADYGDLYVILREDDGDPVKDGSEVYLLLSDGTIVKTEGGEVPAGVDPELLQSVEFGRMNIARAPASVLEHSLVEALSKLDGYVVTEATLDALTDEGGRFLTNDGATIDSPLENLALYEALLTATVNDDGMLVLTATSSHDGADTVYTVLVDPAVRMDLAASAIAASSDKTGELTMDEIVLISSFIDVDDELRELVPTYTYDSGATYKDETVTILVETSPGIYEKQTFDLLDVVEFGDVVRYDLVDGSLVEDSNSTGIDVFTQAADDAVQVIEYVHDNAVE